VSKELRCFYKWMETRYLSYYSDHVCCTSDTRSRFWRYLQHFRPRNGSAAIIATISTQLVPTTSESYMGTEIDALTRCKAILALVIQSYSFCAGNRQSKSFSLLNNPERQKRRYGPVLLHRHPRNVQLWGGETEKGRLL